MIVPGLFLAGKDFFYWSPVDWLDIEHFSEPMLFLPQLNRIDRAIWIEFYLGRVRILLWLRLPS